MTDKYGPTPDGRGITGPTGPMCHGAAGHVGPSCDPGPRGQPGWLPIATCEPPVAENFEVKDETGDVYLARRTAFRLTIDADWPVEPTHWRPVA
jgi:hypothetical protein